MNGLEIRREAEHVFLRLSGSLGASQVAQLFAEIKEICSCRVTVELDAVGVERLDTAVAQLLLWMALHSARFEVSRASPAWIDAAQTLRLSSLLPRNHDSNKRP